MTNIILALARGFAENIFQLVVAGPIDFNGTKLTNIADGTSNQDAVSKKQLQDVIDGVAGSGGLITETELSTALGGYSQTGHTHSTYVPKTEEVIIPIVIRGTTAETGVLAQNDMAIGKSPVAGNITSVNLVSDEASATAEVDVLAGATFSALASLVGAGTKPGLSTAQESTKTTFTNWSGVAVTAGGLIQLKVSTASPTACKTLRGFITITRS